jgi:hypothetical protein
MDGSDGSVPSHLSRECVVFYRTSVNSSDIFISSQSCQRVRSVLLDSHERFPDIFVSCQPLQLVRSVLFDSSKGF